MKTKKIVFILIIVALLGGGLALFQKNRQDKSLVAHNILKFQQMTEAATKSSSSGLLLMASVINKYHQKNGRYPKTLLDLYPDFIPEKSFISKPSWQYSQENGKYLLKKNIRGQNVFASMGPDLKLKTGTDNSQTQPKYAATLNKPELKKTKTVKDEPSVNLKTQSDIHEQKNVVGTVKKVSLPQAKQDSGDAKSEDMRRTPLHSPSGEIVKKKLNKQEEFLLSYDGSKLYIWKTRDGIIGFSDVQYPDEKQMSIYRDQSWIEYGVDPNAVQKN